MPQRRDFIRWSTLAALLAPFMLARQALAQAEAPSAGPLTDWDAVRRLFRITPQKIDLSAMLLASHPEPVRAAIERYRAELDVDTVEFIERNNDRLTAAARAAAGDYLGVHASQVALADSTTMGVGLVYGGLLLRPGDEVVTTREDYYVTYEALRLAARRSGARVREITLYDDPAGVTTGALLERIIGAIGPRTRVLALTWVHSGTGVKLPIPLVGRRLAAINAGRPPPEQVLLCIDGVHGFGVEDTSFVELGCDFLMAGCHKWLFGPRGTGIVAASRSGLDRIDAVIPSFISERSFSAWIQRRPPTGPIDADTLSPGGFKAFEHLWSLPEAFALHRAIGRARVAARTHELASQLKAGLGAIDGVIVHTPRDPALSSGIVAFDLEGADPRDVVRALRGRNIVASVAPYAAPHVRFSPSIRNSPEEVDRAIAAVHEIAS